MTCFRGGIDPNLDLDKIKDLEASKEQINFWQEELKFARQQQERKRKVLEWCEWNRKRKKGFFEKINTAYCVFMLRPVGKVVDRMDEVDFNKKSANKRIRFWGCVGFCYMILIFPLLIPPLIFEAIDEKVHPERYKYRRAGAIYEAMAEHYEK